MHLVQQQQQQLCNEINGPADGQEKLWGTICPAASFNSLPPQAVAEGGRISLDSRGI